MQSFPGDCFCAREPRAARALHQKQGPSLLQARAYKPRAFGRPPATGRAERARNALSKPDAQALACSRMLGAQSLPATAPFSASDWAAPPSSTPGPTWHALRSKRSSAFCAFRKSPAQLFLNEAIKHRFTSSAPKQNAHDAVCSKHSPRSFCAFGSAACHGARSKAFKKSLSVFSSSPSPLDRYSKSDSDLPASHLCPIARTADENSPIRMIELPFRTF